MNYKGNSYYRDILYISKIYSLIFLILTYKILLIKSDKNIYFSCLKGNYSLYNYFKYPQISIIIPNIDKWSLNNNDILNLIMNLKEQTLNNIEIIVTSSKTKIHEYNNLKNLSLSDKRIKIKVSKRKDSTNSLFSLMKLIKGKFVLIINNYFNFKRNDFENFYNFTKGKIKNVFEFKINKKSLYLIKSKILRDIKDINLYFKTIPNLIEYIVSLPEPQLNYIPVGLALNNYYTPLAYTCMTSVLYSKNINSYISFYIIISKDFTQKNIDFIKSLYNQYDYFNITFLIIDNRYDKAFTSRYITKEAYFRFSFGQLIPNLNKIIYLDTDVIVFKDLNNLYNTNFNDKMILGLPFSKNNNFYIINSGILLLNLKKMRELNIEKKTLNILIKKGEQYDFHDQDIMNIYFKEYIGEYPPENHGKTYNDSESIIFNNEIGNLYNNDNLLFSWRYPTMRHYNGYKPSYLDINNKFVEDWWYFARLSKYFANKTNDLNKIFNYSKLD